MPTLKNPRHEKFCQLVVKGTSYTHAYAEVYGASAKSPQSSGSRLMDYISIMGRVAELQEAGAREAVLTLQAAHQFLLDVVEAKPGCIDETSPLCQSYKRTGTTTECKLPDKLRAVELAMKLQGRLREAGDQKIGVSVHTTLPKSLLDAIQQKRRSIMGAGKAGGGARS